MIQIVKHILNRSWQYCTVLVVISFWNVEMISAQEIQFGSYGTYTIDLVEAVGGNIEFGDVETNSLLHEISLSESKIMQIIGIKHLDVGVLITGDGYLLLGGDPNNSTEPDKRIQFTLRVNYSNKGDGSNVAASSTEISLTSNQGSELFPLLERQFLAPGPPPPPQGTFNQLDVQETAELYLYGSINVGEVAAGNYSGTITITVEYDTPPSSH